ncbi:hypothetical protein [Cellulomonas carbonis]|uniref:hypothetical protein n=1 Tax=Cellulomonas carbonis TaxID=1386092 RepID=UPI000694C3F1|nr:hypothetical protein [Cellulomonas carbonis]GGC00896.1 hypothetical protein GCM10010972_12110 [Cellulomonas carbonis]
MTTREALRRQAREADALVERGRRQLLDAVVSARAAGFSQREIAAVVGRSQPEVARLLRMHRQALRPWMTARDAALAIRHELHRGDEDFALRMLVQAVDDFRGLEAPADVADFLRRPPGTGDRKWDTLLGAVVARECRRRDVAAPRWTRRPPLESWWFPVTGGGVLAARTMARTPVDLARLGIWLDAAAFRTA